MYLFFNQMKMKPLLFFLQTNYKNEYMVEQFCEYTFKKF